MDGLEFSEFSFFCVATDSAMEASTKKLRPIDVTSIPNYSFLVPY